MEDMRKNRVRHLLVEKKCNITELSEHNEITRVRLTRQINGSSPLSIDTIDLLLEKFPDISAEWLMRGEGTMDKAGHFAPNIYNSGSIVSVGGNKGSQTISQPSNATLQAQVDSFKDIIAMKDELIATKNKQIDELTLDKHALTTQINTLLVKLPKIK